MSDGELDLTDLLMDDTSEAVEETVKIKLSDAEETEVDDLLGGMMDEPDEELKLDDSTEPESAPTVTVELEEPDEINENSIKVERDKFVTFINCIKLVVDAECTDCDISSGEIRQMSNNKRSIIQVDLSNVLGDMDLSLSMASQKVQLLKTFELDDTVEDEGSIAIEVDDKKIHFTDSFGHLHFNKPMKKMLDNTYLTDEMYNKKVVIVEDEKILECEITNYIAKKRIKSICDAMKTDVISVKLNGETADIVIDTPDIKTTVVKDIKLEKTMPKSKFDILLLPFAMEANSTIKFRVYKAPSGNLLCIFDQTYFKVPVTICITTKLTK